MWHVACYTNNVIIVYEYLTVAVAVLCTDFHLPLFSLCFIYFIYRFQKCTSTSIITFLLSYCTKYNVQQFNVQQVLLAKRPQESHTSYWTSLIPKVSAKSWKFKGRPRHINHHPDTKSTITWKYHQGDHHQKNQHQNY